MIKIENLTVYGFEEAIRGMRNPMNSWEKSDSGVCMDTLACHSCIVNRNDCKTHIDNKDFLVGSQDADLMRRLARSGPVHAKYRRYIDVYVDITAPLYFWKEFDTYRVGVCPNPTDIEMNSCSTMHKIHAKKFTLDDFSSEHLINSLCMEIQEQYVRVNPMQALMTTIECLNSYRELYLETKDKKYWWQIVQLLPSSYNQKRTVKLNYEVLAGMYRDRKSHKLDEWCELMKFFKDKCPYSEIFTLED